MTTEPSEIVELCRDFPTAARVMSEYFTSTSHRGEVPLVSAALAGLLHAAIQGGDVSMARGVLREAVLVTSNVVELQRLRDVRRVSFSAPRGTSTSFAIALGNELGAVMDEQEGDELNAILDE